MQKISSREKIAATGQLFRFGTGGAYLRWIQIHRELTAVRVTEALALKRASWLDDSTWIIFPH